MGAFAVCLRAVLLTCLALGALACQAAPAPAGGRSGAASEVDVMPALEPASLPEGARLRLVATTSIVGDIVQNIGGEHIELVVLLPAGTDPHTFQPSPQDVATVADAHALFVSGAGLEQFLERLLASAGARAVVPVSAGVELQHAQSHVGTEQQAESGQFDPHTWFDPLNVVQWTRNVEQALSALDPRNAAAYADRAQSYRTGLEGLHAWIQGQVSRLPQERRKLVTDHTALTYFASRYGLQQVGAVLPGYSTLAQPSASELAQLEDAIRNLQVPAILVERSVNPALAQRVASDTGTRLVFIYTGSLSEPGGLADSYVRLMEFDVLTIIQALTEGSTGAPERGGRYAQGGP
jgi:manganese/iron transport system substrate-binding protein